MQNEKEKLNDQLVNAVLNYYDKSAYIKGFVIAMNNVKDKMLEAAKHGSVHYEIDSSVLSIDVYHNCSIRLDARSTGMLALNYIKDIWHLDADLVKLENIPGEREYIIHVNWIPSTLFDSKK